MSESHTRSLVKALSWRFLATFITSTIVWFLTGQAGFAMKVGLIDTTIKIVVYFIHERVWLRVPFGKEKNPEFEI